MPPPPLLGYNNNVRHRGRIFHIQTEDSGVASPRIMTHLFADGGRIVKSTRTDYSEHLERQDMVAVVKNMMKEQHKAMFVALRSGELDTLIGFGSDAPPASSNQALLNRAASLLEVQKSAAEAQTVDRADSGEGGSGDMDAPAPEVPEAAPLAIAKSYAASRPASIFSVPPPKAASIFGEVGIDEKSLDDTILSYLAEDDDDEGSSQSSA